MKKSLITLTFGTLRLGVAEFVMMGILPDIARDLRTSIAAAGHLISAYALGVYVDTPMLIIVRRYPLEHILLVLVGIMMIGSLCAALASNYWVLMIARFISGLPHGAYFGVDSTIAEKLADKGRGSGAVSIMIAGMIVINLFGVPLGMALSTMLSWRLAFLLIGCWGIAILYYIWRWIPMVENLPDTGFKGQSRFLRTQAPWLILGTTMPGNRDVFCRYSYISPLLTRVPGSSAESPTVLMILAGLGIVAGSLISGRLSDKYMPGRVAAIAQGVICVTLPLVFLLAQISWLNVLLMCLYTAGLFAVSSPQQVLLIRYSKGGKMLRAASVRVVFNLGNAIGAYCGGLPLETGLGYKYPALIDSKSAFIGFSLLTFFYRKYERTT